MKEGGLKLLQITDNGCGIDVSLTRIARDCLAAAVNMLTANAERRSPNPVREIHNIQAPKV